MSKIYEPQGRAREYSPLALNFYNGCTHKCAYCYVPRMNERFGRHIEGCTPNLDINALEASAKKYQGCEKQILLSFTGDPYCGISPETTTKVLEILRKYNHKVAILTKGGNRVLNDLELIKTFGERIKVGATLTFDTREVSTKWEPGAADPSERIDSLRTLHQNGVKTWVSFEPVIIPEQSLNLLKEVASFVDSVKIGKINNFRGIDKEIDWARFIFDAVRICREYSLPFYIKKDLQKYNNGVYLSGDEINEDFLNL
jgi:DNA repair photolyase